MKTRNKSTQRFTVRDGFHVKLENAKNQEKLESQLLSVALTNSSNQELPSLASAATNAYLANTNEEYDSDSPTKRPSSTYEDTQPQHERLSAKGIETGLKTMIYNHQDSIDTLANASVSRLNSQREGFCQSDYMSQCQVSATQSSVVDFSSNDMSKSLFTTEWLIYRPRFRKTHFNQRKSSEDGRLAYFISEAHDDRDWNQNMAGASRKSVCSHFRRSSSVQPSTYHQHQRLLTENRPPSREYSVDERSLLSSRESNNREVDRLWRSLLQAQSSSDDIKGNLEIKDETQKQAHRPKHKPTENRFSTRRSVFREQAAVVLRSKTLSSRINDLRTLPTVLDRLRNIERNKQQRLAEEHGIDHVEENRKQAKMSLLQRSSETPTYPSAVDWKLIQAQERKKIIDDLQEQTILKAVDRWHKRRNAQLTLSEKEHRIKSWLVNVVLSGAVHQWSLLFQHQVSKKKEVKRLIMVKRIQRCWRHFKHIGSMEWASSAMKEFYRVPTVLKAICTMQKYMRRYLQLRRRTKKYQAIALIISSWTEFQDAKFRRVVLRFRMRVRRFQSIWRSWKAITEARIKLLLMVWNKLEFKARRRFGLTSTPTSLRCNRAIISVTETQDAEKPSLIYSLQNIATVPPKQQKLYKQNAKHLEGVHRHLRNQGVVQAPVSISSSRPGSSSPTRANGPPTTRIDQRIKSKIEEELQHAMRDFYIPQVSKPSISPTKQQSPVKNKGYVYSRRVAVKSLLTRPDPLEAPLAPTRAKVPTYTKINLLRKLLREKRHDFCHAKDRIKEQWERERHARRQRGGNYNIMDELAKYEQLKAIYAVFLLLHSVTETEILQVILQAQRDTTLDQTKAVSAKQEDRIEPE